MVPLSIALAYLPQKDMFRLMGSLQYNVNGRKYTVPAGFETDGFTMKRWGRAFVPRMHGKYFIAAVLHDWMYVNAHTNKRFADKTFYELLKYLGMPKWKAKVYHIAVSIGGKGNY